MKAEENVYSLVQWISQQEWTPPTLVWGSDTPANGSNLTQCYAFFVVQADEILDGCNLTLNSTNYTMSTAGYACYINMSIAVNGTYQSEAYGWDIWDNVNVTESRNFTINCSTAEELVCGGGGGGGGYTGVDKTYICPVSEVKKSEITRDYNLLVFILVIIVFILGFLWRRNKKRKGKKTTA